MDMSTEDCSTGFAGLRSLVTSQPDLEVELTAFETRGKHGIPSTTTAGTAAPSTSTEKSIPDVRAPKSRTKETWYLLAGFSMIFLVGYFSTNSTQPSTPYFPQPSAQSSTQPTSDNSPNWETTTSSSMQYAPGISRKIEQEPAIANNPILSEPEIRYCLFQNERISAAALALDRRSEFQVKRYNLLVDDYNNRCTHFRYRIGVLEQIRREITEVRMQLVLEGQKLLAP